MLRSMTPNTDYFTPLARAVALMDRDAYAARFAVYDREHKALLRRLATADESCSDADVAREEQAFRDAIRRVEFADEADAEDRSTLAPQDEPDEEAPSGPRRDPSWAEVRPLVREAFDVSDLSGNHPPEPSIALEPPVELSDLRLTEPRSVARRVGERLALAALLLVVVGACAWLAGGDQEVTSSTTLRGAVEPAESAEPPSPNDTTEAKAQQPTWLSPEIFYTPPNLAASPPASPPTAGPALASAPRDIPLPVPRPER
jgi:hypothetical protein